MHSSISRCLLAAAVLCLLALVPAHAAEMVTFAFQPPEGGITLLKTKQETKTETVTDGKNTETEVTVTTTKTRIALVKTATGYTMTATDLACSKQVGEKAGAPNFFEKAMLGMPIVVEMDATGQPIAVKGFDAVLEKARKGIDDPELQAAIDRVLGKEKMERLVIEAWNSTVKPFLGQTKKMGDNWTQKVNQLVFSSKLMPVSEKVTLKKPATTAGRACVVIERKWSPDLKEAAKDLGVFFDELGVFPADADPKCSVSSYTVQSTMHMDPTLLMSMQENTTKSYKYKVTNDGTSMESDNKEETVLTVEVEAKP